MITIWTKRMATKWIMSNSAQAMTLSTKMILTRCRCRCSSQVKIWTVMLLASPEATTMAKKTMVRTMMDRCKTSNRCSQWMLNKSTHRWTTGSAVSLSRGTRHWTSLLCRRTPTV